jgi:cyclophilin family peptidyl-prolyl cis-trans isomerase
MKLKLLRAFLVSVFSLMCLTLVARAAPTTNGLYAQFTTSMGTFYCVLRYDLTPRTVANFVSLADGTKAWLDYFKADIVKRPFYNGLTFHRVVTNFVIQGGSPNGLGTDDPGYRFRDEITNALTHSKAGILAMANSGPNTDGSQFYLTLSPQPSLDGHYTIFGEVEEGLNVVTNIGNVATDANNHPLTPVVISNVTIIRIGAAASNFNALAVSPPLPVPVQDGQNIFEQGPDLILVWNYSPTNEYRVCYSGDMKSWNGFLVGTYAGRYMDDFRSSFRIQFFRTIASKID